MANTLLVKVEENHFTIERRKYGRGFQYVLKSGKKISEQKQIKRIKRLVIPPMWQEVKICILENGHIQATGYDQKRRKQYIYHEHWHLARQTEKFSRIVSFAKQLPEMRQLCLDKLASNDWQRDKVLALMVLILDETGLRIGNDRYSKLNQTFGLSTLRRKHVQVLGNELVLDYIGKSGKHREVEIEDQLLTEMIKNCAELPGFSLFRYKNDDAGWVDVDSDEVNEFIKQHMGEQYSCKDFRTWVGTRLAYEFYPYAIDLKAKSPRKKLINILIGLVAEKLGNTATVCRQYYIHPDILQRIESQKIDVDGKPNELEHPVSDPSFSPAEIELLKLLSKT